MNRPRKLGIAGSAMVTLAAFALVGPPPSLAQMCQHGASIFKTCESREAQCATNADCADGIECTNDICDTSISNVTNCTISLGHADTCGDTTQINEAFDIDDFGGDNVRDSGGRQPPDQRGVRECGLLRGPLAPLLRRPGRVDVRGAAAHERLRQPPAARGRRRRAVVTFLSNTYVIQPNDPFRCRPGERESAGPLQRWRRWLLDWR